MPKSSPKYRVVFGDAVMDAGWMAWPHLMMRHYHELGITEEQFVFLMELASMKWDPGDPPTDLGDIAQRMGKGLSTVRKYSQALNAAGLLLVLPRNQHGRKLANEYDLSPLFRRLADVAKAHVNSGDEADDDGITIGPPLPATAPKKAEQMFNRSKMSGTPHRPNRQEMSGTDRQKMSDTERSFVGGDHRSFPGDVNRKKEDQEDQEDQEAAAAAKTFNQILSFSDAQILLAAHPACVPHAAALVAEARKGKKPAGLLIHLVETGWTPPVTPATRHDDDPYRFIRARDGSCAICGGDLTHCRGVHIPESWSHYEEDV